MADISDTNRHMCPQSHCKAEKCHAVGKTRDCCSFCGWIFSRGYTQEWKLSMHIGIGMMLQQLSQIMLQPVSIMFGGHLGKIELDAIALSNSILNVFGNSIAIGICTASDTYFAQAFGLKEYKTVGIVLQRSIMILSLVLLLCYSIYLNMESILLLIGQDPQVASLCQQYVQICMPGIMSLFLYTILRKYMASQNIVLPFIFIGFAGIGICALFQHICLNILHMGVFGSALAQDIACISLVVMSLAYILIKKAHKKTWGGFSVESLEEWGPFAKLGVYGIIMLCLEWWSFEITIFLAGILGTTELGAQGIIFNLVSCFASLLIGMADATCIRAGQTLGGQDPIQAGIVARVGLILNGCIALIISICFVTLNNELPRIFTSDSEVLDLCIKVLPTVAPFMLFDGLSLAGRGILRGTGKQGIASVMVFLALYVIGLPVGISLMYLTPFSIVGCWIGLGIGVCILGVIYMIYTLKIMDYEEESKKAMERIGGHGVVSQTSSSSQPTEYTPLIASDTEHMTKKPLENGIWPEDAQSPQVNRLSKTLILKRLLACGSVLLVLIASLLIRIYTQTDRDKTGKSVNNGTFSTEIPLDRSTF